MLIYERQEKLLQTLHDRRSADLEDLAVLLNVSISTVRRDLDHLALKGLVERTHGGAIFRGDERAPSGEGTSATLTARMAEHVDAKQAIGRYAASLVQPHMTVLMDGGSTVIYAARLITARPIQVVTNSLAIANSFTDDDQVELLIVGGSLYPRTGVMVGPIATGCLADLHADLLLFSLAGIWEEEAYNINLTMSQVEQVMMQQAVRGVMLMDSSKFGRKSLVRVCGLSEVDQIVTDARIDPQWKSRLGEQLVIAE